MIERLDPVRDPSWRELVLSHPRSSVFHSPEWLEALRRTYGFEPVAYVTAGSGSSPAGIPFSLVRSWLTGRRLVSLPFSDHCQPLVDSPEQVEEILGTAQADARGGGWGYVQIRPLAAAPLGALDRSGFRSEGPLYHYQLDLGPDLDTLFKGVKYDVRKDVRRAERSDLRFEVGRDAETVSAYYRLHVMTRSTQGVPPQPFTWFRNLADCLGEMLDVHLLIRDGTPIAGLITILFRDQLMWKYSATDPERDRAGLGKSLMWKSICRAKERGATTLDMGRVDPDNVGLAQFKERWGARRSDLTYLRSPAPSDRPRPRWVSSAARSIIPRLPVPLLAAAGRLAYRHVG
jgi:CelD/BcsL family acetyltransferase involved in cellulose biosynthesis